MRTALLILGLAVLLAACTANTQTRTAAPGEEAQSPDTTVRASQNVSAVFAASQDEIQTTAEGTKYLVHPDEIRSGGPPKDGIPSIDDPRFTSVEQADAWIGDDELVLVVTHNGQTRAYPFQILVWHEIVNDVVGGDPLAITYCPLCGSGIAYHRVLDGEAVEFGTSGKLYNSNLVMYDRKTDTYWTQIEGRAVVGELTGHELVPVDADTVEWGEWKDSHPDAQVLTRDTGYDRQYGRDPYGSYYSDSFLIFPVDERDDRVHAKTVVYGVAVDGSFSAYRESDVEEEGVIEDAVGGVPVRVEQQGDGTVRITRTDTGAVVPKEREFWFAWYAFHPDTQLHGVAPQT